MRDTRRTIEVLTETATRAIQIQAQLSKGRGPNPIETNLPSEFSNAWYYLLACQLHWHHDTMDVARKQARRRQQQLDRAYYLLVSKFEGKKLAELRGVLPHEFMIFLLKRALKDFTVEQPNLSESYWEYYTELVCQVSVKY